MPPVPIIRFSPKKPNAPQYAKLLDRGLAAMRKSGELASILAKYDMTD
jgi:ABC-type amino acid transport substrate-binding protein